MYFCRQSYTNTYTFLTSQTALTLAVLSYVIHCLTLNFRHKKGHVTMTFFNTLFT
jgi:hypothetical protein